MIKKHTPFSRLLIYVGALLMAHALLVPLHAGGQTLSESNLQTGKMFLNSGNLRKAEQYFMVAMEQASTASSDQLLDTQMALVDVLKFWQPVEAQRWAKKCENGSHRDAPTRLHFLLQNACISFTLGNTRLFNTHYEQYHQLLDANDSLPAEGLRTMEAMHESLLHFYDEALRQLNADDSDADALTRINVQTIIYQQAKDTVKILESLRRRADIIDSLTTALYDANIHAGNATASMTRAQLKAEAASHRMLKIVLVLCALIIMMLIVWIYLRIKQHKEVEKKNKQLTTALLMANETDHMKMEFVHRVSHEIRTPLNAITGFNDILNNTTIELSHEERADLMERIGENVKLITNIVDEMLKIADVESTVKYPKDKTVRCNDFFSDIIYSHRNEVKSSVELNYSTRVVNRKSITINEGALKDIMEHLINNAIKFTNEGYIELSCHEEKGMIHLTLTDTGCGVPIDKQDEIFEKFAKGDAFVPGIGLGLTVSRNIARKMGGDLVLDKNYTNGARFVLTIPTG